MCLTSPDHMLLDPPRFLQVYRDSHLRMNKSVNTLSGVHHGRAISKRLGPGILCFIIKLGFAPNHMLLDRPGYPLVWKGSLLHHAMSITSIAPSASGKESHVGSDF